MDLILMVAEAIGLVLGRLAVSALICWSLWYMFRLVSHPEWSALAILNLFGIALLGLLPKSLFLTMALIFAVLAAVMLWVSGRAWRRDRLEEPALTAQQQLSEPKAAAKLASSTEVYPAISAVIREDRPPTRDEVHRVAVRLWDEGPAFRLGSPPQPASLAARRVVLRTPRAALSGTQE